jgi:hypothetical protein
MNGILTGVAVGVAMIVINGIVEAVVKARRNERREAKITHDNAARIEALERQQRETKELARLTLGTCIILGDGMMQNGINGEFRRAFCDKKQDALKML